MSDVSPARRIAFDVLAKVEAGGLSDQLLVTATAGLEPRDAGLAYELTLGVLRRQLTLDFLIAHHGGLHPEKLDPPVRRALRLGLYQLRFLERIPPHAAVGESVELVKRSGKRSAAGLVNAVLRKERGQEVRYPNRAVAWSMPEWLLERWGARGESIARHALTVPPSGMDEGARAIVPLLEIHPGETFLDLCAAPGNKTRHAREFGPSLTIACDRSLPRLSQVDGPRVLLDAAQPLPFRHRFDCVLLDAPCSGTGTLARNPEIKWRLTPEDLGRHQRRQQRMLAEALKAGRRVLYATCSLEPEEDEQVVESHPGLVRTVRRWPGEDKGDGFFAALFHP